MNEKSVHIISRGQRWALKKRGAHRALKIYDDKAEAIMAATKFLSGGYDVFIHRKDGTVDVWKKAPARLRHVA